jgi:hypothetical protein
MAKRIVRLTESELIDLVRRTIFEAKESEEVLVNEDKMFGVGFMFPENGAKPVSYASSRTRFGQIPYTRDEEKFIVRDIVNFLDESGTFEILEEWYDRGIPPFVRIVAGTSHSGSYETNARVGEQRLNFLKGLLKQALDQLGLNAVQMARIATTNTTDDYRPSRLDVKFFDPKKLPLKDRERFGLLSINGLMIQGLTPGQMIGTSGGLQKAKGNYNNIMWDTVDEDKIVEILTGFDVDGNKSYEFNGLSTLSDIKELNAYLKSAGEGDLQTFLNDQLFDDYNRKTKIYTRLKNKPGLRGRIAMSNDGDITISLD